MSTKIIIPGSAFSSDAKAELLSPGGIGAQDVQDDFLEQGQILRGIVFPYRAGILSHRDIEHPMQLVFDRPVRTHCLSDFSRRQRARADDHKTVTAKGGIKPGPDVEDENAFMLDLTLNRLPGQKLTYESFISMRDQLPLELDLQTETRETRINLEYDFKRKLIASSVRMIQLAGTDKSHLAFDTEPWNTVDEALTTRLIFDAWRDDHCLKSLEDFQTWEYYRAFKMANLMGSKPAASSTSKTEKRTGRKNLTKGGYLAVAKQLFLGIYQKKMWGLDGADLSQRKLAEWLTSQGYKTSVSAVKNGTREQPAEHLVPATDEVVAFLDKMKERFPGLETDKFLIR